jgi:hypothetical protein
VSERWQLWIAGKEGYVSPSPCANWPTYEGAVVGLNAIEKETPALRGQISIRRQG